MTTRPRPRDTHRPWFKWQRGLIVEVFIATRGQTWHPAYPVCCLPDYHYFVRPTPFSFSLGAGPVLRFLRFPFLNAPADLALFFWILLRRPTDAPPLFFRRIFSCSFLSSADEPTARRNRCRRIQSIAASRDKRVRPYRCRFAAFSRSIIPAGCHQVWRETMFTRWPWMMFLGTFLYHNDMLTTFLKKLTLLYDIIRSKYKNRAAFSFLVSSLIIIFLTLFSQFYIK